MKIRPSVGLAFVLVALVAAQYLLLPDWYRSSAHQISAWLIFLSIATGLVCSVAFTHLLIQKLTAASTRPSKVGAYIGGFGVYPLGLFGGFIVGGNFGGALGERAFGAIGTIVGIGLGIAFVTTTISLAGALLGAFVGGLVGRVVHQGINRRE